MKTKLIMDGDAFLSSKIEQELYRIAQEALNNTLKHADASEVSVYLKSCSDGIDLKIADNGIGFDQNLIDPSRGLGIENMRTRAERLGGQFTLESSPHQGTQVSVSIRYPAGMVLT
jgi:NarL family two-component system sensor histidine kinase LiaS